MKYAVGANTKNIVSLMIFWLFRYSASAYGAKVGASTFVPVGTKHASALRPLLSSLKKSSNYLTSKEYFRVLVQQRAVLQRVDTVVALIFLYLAAFLVVDVVFYLVHERSDGVVRLYIEPQYAVSH